MSNMEPLTGLADYDHILFHIIVKSIVRRLDPWGLCISLRVHSNRRHTIALVEPRLATIAAMVLTAQVDTSATVLAVSVVVVEVAERWSA